MSMSGGRGTSSNCIYLEAGGNKARHRDSRVQGRSDSEDGR